MLLPVASRVPYYSKADLTVTFGNYKTVCSLEAGKSSYRRGQKPIDIREFIQVGYALIEDKLYISATGTALNCYCCGIWRLRRKNARTRGIIRLSRAGG